jgi:hypothetical protein
MGLFLYLFLALIDAMVCSLPCEKRLRQIACYPTAKALRDIFEQRGFLNIAQVLITLAIAV